MGRPGDGPAGLELPTALRWLLYGLVALCFVGVVSLRGGPAVADASDVVVPSTQLSHGQLAAAADHPGNPNPPGYVVFAAAFTAVLRPLIGSSDWCVHTFSGCESSPLDGAARAAAPGPWYRSQAAIALGAWLVLEASLVALFAALGRGGTLVEATCLFVVALSPATSDTVVSFFHPQDLLCCALVVLAETAGLRGRWLAAGAALGAAFACKQFALLAALPLLMAAPSGSKRTGFLGAAAATAALFVVPFFVVAPAAMMHSLAATGILGSPRGLSRTIVGSLPGYAAPYALARYGPLLLVVVICSVAWWGGHGRRAPGALLGLVLACLASRLVFEQAALRYYLLAVAVLLVCLDGARGRWPVRSAVWIGLTSLWWQPGVVPASLADSFTPIALLAAAVAALWIGLDALPPRAGAESALLDEASPVPDRLPGMRGPDQGR